MVWVCVLMGCRGTEPEVAEMKPGQGRAPLATLSSVVIPERGISEEDERLTVEKGALLLNDTLFSGTLYSRFENGSVRSEHEYFEGRPEGRHRGYHADGSRAYLMYFREGMKVGEHKAWYENGQIKYKYYFVEDKAEGSHRNWSEDGSLQSQIEYRGGTIVQPSSQSNEH